jgi:DNA repair protein RadC
MTIAYDTQASTPTRARRSATPTDAAAAQRLREAITPYLDLNRLRKLVAASGDLSNAMVAGTAAPEVQDLLELLAALLRPGARQQVRTPDDIAALLMVEMAYLDQEQLRVACLDNKNRIQRIVTVYQGNVNSSIIRVGEVFKEALRLNSVAIIVAHNHPSGDGLSPSPEDILITRQLVEAGKLLDCELLDHLLIGRGSWTSMRQKGLGFPT